MTDNEKDCPPDYNGGFCDPGTVDCDACWDEWLRENAHQPEKIQVNRGFVDVGKWENPFGEVVEFKGSMEYMVRYYGECPLCRQKICVDCVIGTYADPTYPRYCEECGARNKE